MGIKGKQIANGTIKKEKLDLVLPTLGKDPVTKSYFDNRKINDKPLSGDITLNLTDVGGSNLDNTSDINKPVSNPQRVALNQKLSYGTIAEFRASTDTTFTTFQITDKYKAGIFKYDSLDTTTPDDNSIVLVQSGRRFKRQIDGEINVRWWNVTGNGVTDDTIEFMKAVTYWATNGGNLLIPYGTYRVDMPTEYNPTASPAITVPSNIKKLTITGSNATLKTRKGLAAGGGVLRNDFSAFRLEGHAECDLEVNGLKIEGSRLTEIDDYDYIAGNIYVPWSARTANNCFGFFFKNFNHVIINQCSVKNLHGRAIVGDVCKKFQVTNSIIENISRSAIETTNTTLNLIASGNIISDIGIFKETFAVN